MELRYVLLAPLLGALLNGIILRPKNAGLAGGIGSFFSFLSFLFAVIAIQRGIKVDEVFTWIEAGKIRIPFTLELTPITSIMLMVVTGIGTLIHLYATSYMSHDKSPHRFFAYLNLFLAAMLVLILSGNLVGIFMGWEGVGLCSYLLIGFWHHEEKNAAAGMKAFVTNRIGDLGFIVALLLLLTYAGTTQISELLQIVAHPSGQIPAWVWTVVAAALFWASTGKSAQIPLYVWLPDAMAGPTPVSALIHAATMVTSGIFISCRLWPLFASQPGVLDFMLWGGLATAWLAALIALTQRDIKKVLAYSTVSQLGFMFVALGVGSPVGALFHVVTHACFKALLFLGAGSVIHGMHEEQDLFKMGGLKSHMKWTHLTFLTGTLAIIGFPLTSGFFSKDLILEQAFVRGPLYWGLLLGAALLTAFYMFRCYALAFWGSPRSEAAHHAHESSPLMTGPLIVLAVLSLVVGWLQTPHVVFGINIVKSAVEASAPIVHAEGAESHHLSEALEWGLMLITSLLSLTVAYAAWKKFSNFKDPQKELHGFSKASFNKFYVDEIYEFLFIRPLRFFSKHSTRVVDEAMLDGTAHGLKDSLSLSGQVLSLFHSGNLQTYAWYLAVGTALIVLCAWGIYL